MRLLNPIYALLFCAFKYERHLADAWIYIEHAVTICGKENDEQSVKTFQCHYLEQFSLPLFKTNFLYQPTQMTPVKKLMTFFVIIIIAAATILSELQLRFPDIFDNNNTTTRIRDTLCEQSNHKDI